MRLKVLMVLPQFPFPPDQGAKLRNSAFIRALAEEHEVHLLCFSNGVAQERPRGQECAAVHMVPAPRRSRLERAGRMVISQLPDLALRLWSPAFARTLSSVVSREAFDVVHVSNLELARYLPLVSGPKRVFDDHNAEYVLQRRAYETEAEAGAWRPATIYSLLQWQRLRQFEAQACRGADLVLAVSDADARHLVELWPGIDPLVIPNALDLEYYQMLAPARQQRPFLLFSGKLDYRPNQDAVRWFLDAILPRVWASRPQVRWLVVGQAPPGWLVERGRRDQRIVVTGAVADDRPYVERSAIYVLPMRWGGGVRFKALVALASGRPLVSTSLGVEGVGCTPNENALIADDPEQFAGEVLRLLEDDELAASLTRAGRRLVEERFAWPRIMPKLLEAYRMLELARPSIAPVTERWVGGWRG